MIAKIWKQESWIGKISYLLTGILFIWLPFEGLVLNLFFDIQVIGFDGGYALYIVTMICAIIARKWLLLLVVAFGTIFIFAAMIGIAEVLGYYLHTWFGIGNFTYQI